MNFGRVAAVAMMAVTVLLISAPAVSAEGIHEIPSEVDSEFNCNFYELNFQADSDIDASYTVTYEAFGILRDGVGTIEVKTINVPQPTRWYVEFDPEDVRLCKTVYITQHIMKGETDMEYVMKVNIIAPPPEGESYTVTYYDGYTGTDNPWYVEEVESDRYSEVGKNFIYPPEPPVRVGYSFVGWFTDPDNNVLLDPKKPVESDINAFAKWMYSGVPDPDNPGGGPAPGAIAQKLTVIGDYKTDYVVGESLNTTGLTVMAEYSDGTSFEVTHLCVFTPTKFTAVGTADVSAVALGLVAVFEVNVSDSFVAEEGSDITEYLLAALVVLLAVILLVVVVRKKN